MSQPQRLHKLMARAGVASRRRSEDLILRGQVKVDGNVIREVGIKVDPEVSDIEVMGKLIEVGTVRAYVALNKPPGYITSVVDPYGRPTVMKFVDDHAENLFPIGRLDMDTEGLLLFTNDGELAYRLTHPKFKVVKTYSAIVRGAPKNDAIWKLRQGVQLEDGKTAPATVRIIEKGTSKTSLQIIISEGKKRQVRRMCRAVGHPVIKLKRTAIGPIGLEGLETGQTKELSCEEIANLMQAVGLTV